MPCHMFMQNTKYGIASGLKLFRSLNHFTTSIHNMKRERRSMQDNNEQIYAKRVFAKG